MVILMVIFMVTSWWLTDMTGWWFGTWLDYDFPSYWEFHHSNWRTHIFQRGRSTTNQIIFTMKNDGNLRRKTNNCEQPMENGDEVWCLDKPSGRMPPFIHTLGKSRDECWWTDLNTICFSPWCDVAPTLIMFQLWNSEVLVLVSLEQAVNSGSSPSDMVHVTSPDARCETDK
jgi:hypothetical protein